MLWCKLITHQLIATKQWQVMWDSPTPPHGNTTVAALTLRDLRQCRSSCLVFIWQLLHQPTLSKPNRQMHHSLYKLGQTRSGVVAPLQCINNSVVHTVYRAWPHRSVANCKSITAIQSEAMTIIQQTKDTSWEKIQSLPLLCRQFKEKASNIRVTTKYHVMGCSSKQREVMTKRYDRKLAS